MLVIVICCYVVQGVVADYTVMCTHCKFNRCIQFNKEMLNNPFVLFLKMMHVHRVTDHNGLFSRHIHFRLGVIFYFIQCYESD